MINDDLIFYNTRDRRGFSPPSPPPISDFAGLRKFNLLFQFLFLTQILRPAVFLALKQWRPYHGPFAAPPSMGSISSGWRYWLRV